MTTNTITFEKVERGLFEGMLSKEGDKDRGMDKVNPLEGLISPAQEIFTDDVYIEHAAEPIKSLEDILYIKEMLLGQERYRDYMLFILGINFGLRVSDLRELRFWHLINEDFTFKDTFPIFERKTRNTRKRSKNRYITINEAVKEAVMVYLKNTRGVQLDHFVFRSLSNRGAEDNRPLSRMSIDRILKGIGEEAGLGIRVATHTLRKTFCYWIMMNGDNSDRTLFLLQSMLGHSSPLQTLTYIGLTEDEISEAYRGLNLGRRDAPGRNLIPLRLVERAS